MTGGIFGRAAWLSPLDQSQRTCSLKSGTPSHKSGSLTLLQQPSSLSSPASSPPISPLITPLSSRPSSPGSNCRTPGLSYIDAEGGLDIDRMRRVLGSLHIRVGTENLKKGKTQREDAPFGGIVAREPVLCCIVIGSGFAGFSAAIALARQGYQVTLLERGSGLSPHGDLISFCPNANRILRRWGVDEAMWRRAVKGGYVLIKDHAGTTVEQLDNKRLAKQYGSPMFQGHRAQFLGVFGVEARMLGVEVVPYTEIVDVLDNSERPACIAADGRIFTADCVIIADGANSKLRCNVFGTASKESYTGYSIHRSITKVTHEFRNDPLCGHLLDGNVRVWLGEETHVFFSSLDNGNQMSVTITHKDIDKDSSFDWRDIKPMTDVDVFIKGWDPTLAAALKHFRTGLHWRLFHHDPIPTWISHNGRCAFAGDAIHTYLPTSFQGATASVEDGATLGICLALAGGKPSGVHLALRVYERLRQDIVRQKAEAGFHQRENWNRYHRTKDLVDLPILAEKFFAEDAETYAFTHFESIAKTLVKGYRLDEHTKVRVMQMAGF